VIAETITIGSGLIALLVIVVLVLLAIYLIRRI
jgi:hypothetical protein